MGRKLLVTLEISAIKGLIFSAKVSKALASGGARIIKMNFVIDSMEKAIECLKAGDHDGATMLVSHCLGAVKSWDAKSTESAARFFGNQANIRSTFRPTTPGLTPDGP